MAAVVTDLIRVEVVYALPDDQRMVVVQVPAGSNAIEAAAAARLEDYFSGFRLEPARLGLWGQAFGTKGLPSAGDYIVKTGDRIECYRPLTCDPMEVRRRRASKAAGRTTSAPEEKI